MGSVVAMKNTDIDPYATTIKKAKKLREEIHKDCNKAHFFDYFSNPWVPTTIFVTSALYQGFSSYRAHALPTLTSLKQDFESSPKVLLTGSLILLSCMAYNYYKGRISSLWSSMSEAYHREKKTN